MLLYATIVLCLSPMSMDYCFYIINFSFFCLWKFRLSPYDTSPLNKTTITNKKRQTDIVSCVYVYAVVCFVLEMGLHAYRHKKLPPHHKKKYKMDILFFIIQRKHTNLHSSSSSVTIRVNSFRMSSCLWKM